MIGSSIRPLWKKKVLWVVGQARFLWLYRRGHGGIPGAFGWNMVWLEQHQETRRHYRRSGQFD
jgi:hypothetical protein